jgi:parvulin-like peptidyl-prolyl isomerase
LAQAAPDDFGDLAKQQSEDTNSAAARGMIPPIRRHVGNEEIERVAFSLKQGEISPVIHAANQYLILKCEEQLPETYVAGKNLELIKQQLHDQIRDEKLRDAAPSLFKDLQQRAKVVNIFNNPALRQQMPGVAATVNDRQITMDQLSDECYLRHGKDVLEGEINRSVLQQELKRQDRMVTDKAIDEEIARAADAYGYLKPDSTPDVEAWLKSVTEADGVTVDLYVRDAVWPSVALKALVNDRVQITQVDLDRGFASNYGERVKVLVTVLGNQRQAQQVWKEARTADSDKAFGEMAHQYSIEPVSRANFGKVPPVRRFGGQKLIEDEAFRLKQGELSQIIAAGDKHIIMRCLGRTEPIEVDRQAVEVELRKDIQEKKLRLEMAKEFDRLKEFAQIDNFLAGTSQTGKRHARAAAPPRAGQPVKRTSFQQSVPAAPKPRR